MSGNRMPPPSTIETVKLQSVAGKEVYIARLSEPGVVEAVNRLSSSKMPVSKVDYYDFLIDTCLVNPESTIKKIYQDGFPLHDVLREIISTCVWVNPGLHPGKRVFVNSKGILAATEFPGSGFIPLSKNECWPFPIYNSLKYSENSFLSSSELIEKGLNSIYWKERAIYLLVKTFDSEEIDSLLRFKSQLSTYYYRKLVGFSGLGNYCHVKSLLTLVNPSNEVDNTQQLYAVVISHNPGLVLERGSALPLDLDSGLSKADNPIAEAIERYIEEEDEDEEEEDMNVVFTTETAKDKKKPVRIQKKTFDDVRPEDILTLGKRIKAQVFGQDEAIDRLIRGIKRAKAGLHETNRPIVTALLTGQTGSGKTKTCKVIAEELIQESNALIRIDCSEYGREHEVMKLLGAPPSYVGFEEGGILSNKLTQYPFCVILFDEIEKAHPNLFDILLQIFDEARLTDSKGRLVSFSQAVIIMTSNLGSREIDKALGGSMGFATAKKDDQDVNVDKIVMTRLKKFFKPEFLNRIDEIVVFKTLGQDVCHKIVELELMKIRRRLSKRGYKVVFDGSVAAYLVKEGFTPEYGARPLLRIIKKQITDVLADEILSSNLDELDKLVVEVEDGTIQFKKVYAKNRKKAADSKKSAEDIEKILLSGNNP